MSDSAVQVSSMLKKDRTIVLAAIVGVIVIAWTYLVILKEMPAREMTGLKPWTSLDFTLMFLMWSVMMVGMMLPSAMPAILNFAALSRERQRHGQTYVPTAVFVMGYLVVWFAFSLTATLLQWLLNSLALLSPMLVLTSPILGGLLLIAAGIYQWSPIHKNFLSRCRNPLEILNRRFGEEATAFNMGLENGAYCLGCCAVLMLLLFVGGVMNLLWVALIAIFVLIEKALPYGDFVARWSAIPLALAGVAVIVLHYTAYAHVP
jgi:predicted metal-binding membrane protein